MTQVQHIGDVQGRVTRLPFSSAVVAGDYVYCSGEVGFAPGTTTLVDGGIEEQTRQALRNLGVALEAAGSSLANVIKTLVFISDEAAFPGFNRAYASFFPDGRYPARSTLVSGFVAPGVLVEIECVALRTASYER